MIHPLHLSLLALPLVAVLLPPTVQSARARNIDLSTVPNRQTVQVYSDDYVFPRTTTTCFIHCLRRWHPYWFDSNQGGTDAGALRANAVRVLW